MAWEDRVDHVMDRLEQLIRQEEDQPAVMEDLAEILADAGLVPIGALPTNSASSFTHNLGANLVELRGNWQFPGGDLEDYETAEDLLLSLLN